MACSTILDEEFLASLPVSRTSVACNGSCWVLWSSAGCSFTLSSDGVCIRAVRSSGFQPCSPTWCFSFFWEERWHWTAATTACCTTSRRDGTNCYRLARGSTAPRKFSSPTVSAPGLCLLSDRTTSSTTIVTSKRRHSLSYGNLFLTDSLIHRTKFIVAESIFPNRTFRHKRQYILTDSSDIMENSFDFPFCFLSSQRARSGRSIRIRECRSNENKINEKKNANYERNLRNVNRWTYWMTRDFVSETRWSRA